MQSRSQRGLLLLGVMLTVCSFVPSMASAAAWSPVGTTHQLFSPNLQFTASTSPFGPEVGWSCAGSELDADVASAQTLVITSARFSNCTGTLAFANCALTPTFTGPWQATAISTTNIQIHNVRLDITFEGTPGVCLVNGATVLLTGTLAGGTTWNASTNEALLTNATGLTAHYMVPGFPPSSSSTTINGTLRDTTNMLRMFD